MKDDIAIPVGETDRVADSGSPAKDQLPTVTEEVVIPEMSPEQEQVAIETARSVVEPVTQDQAAAICDAGGPVQVEPIGDYYDQGESVVEVTVEAPKAGASPSEATEVDTQGESVEAGTAAEPVDSSQQQEGTEETADGSSPSPNTSSATFRVSKDECPGTTDEHCTRKTLNAKWSPKHGRCEKCGVALTKAGNHRKRRNDAGSQRESYNRSQ